MRFRRSHALFGWLFQLIRLRQRSRRRPALIKPPWITAMNRDRSSRIAISLSTSPSTTRISASLPGSSVPNSWLRPMISAPVLVAHVMVSIGVNPTYLTKKVSSLA